MGSLKIARFPNASLRKNAAEVVKVTDLDRKILSDMAETMYLSGGVGLAANQVGIDKRLAVIDVGAGLIKMINPLVVKKEGCETQEEGCLSVPDVSVKVKRAKKIVIDYLTEEGHVQRISATGLFARAIQHELDHLSGKVIVDYLNPIKKLFLKKKK